MSTQLEPVDDHPLAGESTTPDPVDTYESNSESNPVVDTPLAEFEKLGKATLVDSDVKPVTDVAIVSGRRETISTQPGSIPNLSIAEAAPPKDFIANLTKRRSGFRCFFFCLNGCNEGLYNLLLLSWIGVVYWIPGGIFILIVASLIVGVSFGIAAAHGAIAMLIGNAILRASHFAHYTDNASAAAIGATGVLLACLCIGILTQWLPVDENGQSPWYITIPITTLVMTLTGTIGSSLLLRHHVDIGDIDVLHATRAGALGGSIMGPAALVVGPVIVLALGILFSPLWLAMSLGFRWVYGRSSESWEGNTYRSSSCYTYGSCGDDPDINEEIERFEQAGSRVPWGHGF